MPTVIKESNQLAHLYFSLGKIKSRIEPGLYEFYKMQETIR